MFILGAGKRRARPCIYCNIMSKTLTRHLKNVHKTEPEIQATLALSPKQQRVAFNQLKRKGIKKHNMEQIGMKQPDLICERQATEGRPSVNDLIVCGKCSGFFKRKAFYKHKKNCQFSESSRPVNLSLIHI